MKAFCKPILIIMVIILLMGHLLGEIKVTAGKLLIPTSAGEKPYNCVMVITQEGIEFKCTMKIFQPFNQFDTPRQAKIKVNTAEVEEVQIYMNKIYISTHEPFWRKYRNILQHLYLRKYAGCFEYRYIEKWILLFAVENPADMGAVGEALIKLTGGRCEILKDEKK
jgi:hypothetical protein